MRTDSKIKIQDDLSEDDEIYDDTSASESEADQNDSTAQQDNAELTQLESQLASVPFGQLLQVQEKMGSKQFEKLNAMRQPNGETRQAKTTTDVQKRKEIQKRANKNAPTEMTSKKTVSRKRQVVEVPKIQRRDPRFSNKTGHLNEDLFKKSYSFLSEYRSQEKAMLKEQLSKTKNQEEKLKLQRTIQSIESRESQAQREEKRKELKRVWKKTELQAIKEGKKKKPYFLKESDLRKLEVIDKVANMKDRDVDKLLEKKRKRNTALQGKFMPNKRR